jgi:hypothetical protein
MSNGQLKIDRISFNLGMINCFVEMVACGVKRLAISPPVRPEDYPVIRKGSERIVENFGIKSYLDTSLMVTGLQPEEFTAGKWSILYYEEDGILRAYLDLKKRKEALVKSGRFNGDERKEISRAFGRLLSYPEDKIERKLAGQSYPEPFMLVD